jgi:hypothetical protein
MKLPTWSLIVGAWVALITATVVTVRICNKNSPATVPLDPPSHAR